MPLTCAKRAARATGSPLYTPLWDGVVPEAETASPAESPASAARLLVLTLGDVTRDPRARRAAQTALGRGLDVDAVCLSIGGGTPVDVPGLRVTQIGTERVSDRL